jgi:hypothetical protein
VMSRVLLGFCVGVNRVLLERVEYGEVCLLGSRERVWREGVGLWEMGERGK